MSQLKIVSDPLHRKLYPGEMYLNPYTLENKGVVKIYCFHLGIKYCEVSDAVYKTVEHGQCTLYFDSDGEPLSIAYHLDEGDSDPIECIKKNAADLEHFVGSEIAAELIGHMIRQYEGWVKADKPFWFDAGDLVLEFENMGAFENMSAFYKFFGHLCEQVAEKTGQTYDHAEKLQEFVDFWSEQSGELNVPGQQTWYVKHGPTETGETKEDYLADWARFDALVIGGLLAAKYDLREVRRG